MRHIDFTAQEKAATHEYKQNADAVARRVKKREKRITRQVRLSESNARKLKLRAVEEGVPMSLFLDEIVEGFFMPSRKEVSTEKSPSGESVPAE